MAVLFVQRINTINCPFSFQPFDWTSLGKLWHPVQCTITTTSTTSTRSTCTLWQYYVSIMSKSSKWFQSKGWKWEEQFIVFILWMKQKYNKLPFLFWSFWLKITWTRTSENCKFYGFSLNPILQKVFL